MVLRKMFTRLLPAFILPFLFASCSFFEPGSSILRGNYAYQKGDYQTALLRYLSREEESRLQQRIIYNKATVYYALGEGQSALELWQEIDDERDRELLFAAGFNAGVVYYRSGQFVEAYHAFRRTLELNPASLDAKKNLELTLERLEAETRSPDSRPDESLSEVSDDARRILQYIKRKEGSRWKAQEEPSDAVRDW
jgi:Ca-activated chloride channel family protein